ncbi:MAG: aldehyde dehydrogenase family protein [Candidatus Dojkabacteria bacterium]|nr:MAG: aldehyde dehydrogenase family protein [Candidatus Dojkabacteria bacterium]
MANKKTPKPGRLVYRNQGLYILNFSGLDSSIQQAVLNLISSCELEYVEEDGFTTLILKGIPWDKYPEIARKISKPIELQDVRPIRNYLYDEPIEFSEVEKVTSDFCDFLENNREEIASALQGFETYNVVLDEIARSVDHLRNISKNREYFKKKVYKTVSFLPLNQPLYAFVCFGVIPSLMSELSFVRPPEIVQPHFVKLANTLNIQEFFPNITVHLGDRPSYRELTKGDIDVVIFTGRPENAKRIYSEYECKLFIFNGSGHNPIVVSESADVKKATESILRVCLQNQGQDCAAPNSILVHKEKLNELKNELMPKLDEIEMLVGDYKDRKNILGPNSNPSRLLEIFELLYRDKDYCIRGGEVNIITNIIKPTVFEKRLELGGNFDEFYAPVIMLQPYESDADLQLYFEDQQYYPNAMYVTVFGESKYVNELANKEIHNKENILHNTDLHVVERGFLPYGGLGPNASCVYFNDQKIPGATLPQRDIYNYLINEDFVPAKGIPID